MITVEEEEVTPKPAAITNRLGVVFNFNKPAYPFFSVDLVEGQIDEEGGFADTVQKQA